MQKNKPSSTVAMDATHYPGTTHFVAPPTSPVAIRSIAHSQSPGATNLDLVTPPSSVAMMNATQSSGMTNFVSITHSQSPDADESVAI
jgi:hypothetical protein